jgi:hypothetical protein
MADIKRAYGTATSFTITLNSLASSGTVGRESTVVDNSSVKMLDALVEATIAFPNSAAANEKAVYIFAYGSLDGTNYPESLTGADAGYTFQGAAGALLTALRLIGVVPMNTNTTAGKRYGPWAVAPAFGGLMPAKWGIAVLNYCGQTLHSSNNAAQYREVFATVA